MRKRFGIIFLVVGILCVSGAIGLITYNALESDGAGDQSHERVLVLQDYMNREIDPSRVTVLDTKRTDADDDLDPVVYLDGYDYIGALEIPQLKLNLPVMSTWDYEKLRLSPCRQFGSAKDGNLVIAAHNYSTHFGRINTLIPGDEITFTAMDGTVYTYEVAKSEVVSPTDVEKVAQSGYPLVLYTCTKGGERRVAVFCNLKTDSENQEIK